MLLLDYHPCPWVLVPAEPAPACLLVQGVVVFLLEALVCVRRAGLGQRVLIGGCQGVPGASLGRREGAADVQGLLEDRAVFPEVPVAGVGLAGPSGP